MEMTARLVGYMMRTALQSSRKLKGVRARVARASHALPSWRSRPSCVEGDAPWGLEPKGWCECWRLALVQGGRFQQTAFSS